jgi:hypothetical protein
MTRVNIDTTGTVRAADPQAAEPNATAAETPHHKTRRTERRSYQRHLGHAEVCVIRDTDVMRDGLPVQLENISAAGMGILSPVPFRVDEQLKFRLRNEVQRFSANLRGIVRWIEPKEDGSFRCGIELSTRLMPFDVMMLRRAGVGDQSDGSPEWV